VLGERISEPPYIMGNFPRIEVVFALIDKKAAAAPSNERDKYSDLTRLKQLLDDGTLTQDEYDREKAVILNQKWVVSTNWRSAPLGTVSLVRYGNSLPRMRCLFRFIEKRRRKIGARNTSSATAVFQCPVAPDTVDAGARTVREVLRRRDVSPVNVVDLTVKLKS